MNFKIILALSALCNLLARGRFAARRAALCLLPLFALLHLTDARAAFTMNLYQCGNNVVASGSGSFIPGPRYTNGAGFNHIKPSLAQLYTGGNSGVFNYWTSFVVSGPANFGPGATQIFPNTLSGTYVVHMGTTIGLATGYVSGTSITSGAVFNSKTLAGLGATVGSYQWTWGSGASADSYTLNITATPPSPMVASVSSASGSAAGGDSITVSGCGFTGATAITVGGNVCTSFTAIDDTTATCTTPAGTAGPASVLVTTPGGTSAANTLFTYTAVAPTVISVTPSSGPLGGGTGITITGTNLTGATGVTVGGAACTNVTLVNATTVTCTSPAGSVGTASVLITTAGGTNAANTLFTYAAPVAGSIPTLSEWAMIFMASLMAMFGYARLRNRRS